MYRDFIFLSVAFMAMTFVLATGGCGKQAASAPSGSDIESFQKSNPGVLVPASEELDDNS